MSKALNPSVEVALICRRNEEDSQLWLQLIPSFDWKKLRTPLALHHIIPPNSNKFLKFGDGFFFRDALVVKHHLHRINLVYEGI